MKKSLFVLFVVIFCCSGRFCNVESPKPFTDWINEWERDYSTEEEFRTRERIYLENAAFVRNHNTGNHSYCVRLNEFADLTSLEFYHSRLMNVSIPSSYESNCTNVNITTLPEQFDWRYYNVVTEVKQQGQCSSCWAFVSTGVVESYNAIIGNPLVSLSEQNLMDCSYIEGNRACNGGTVDASLKYIIKNAGIDTEESYPYQMSTSVDCKYNINNRGAIIYNFTDIQRGCENEMQNAIVNNCPVGALIDGNDPGFQFYSSGIYYNPYCSTWRLNHAVLVVGYGIDTNNIIPEYWIAKNSYGTNWGMNGYINMARNQNNNCGIATRSSYPK